MCVSLQIGFWNQTFRAFLQLYFIWSRTEINFSLPFWMSSLSAASQWKVYRKVWNIINYTRNFEGLKISFQTFQTNKTTRHFQALDRNYSIGRKILDKFRLRVTSQLESDNVCMNKFQVDIDKVVFCNNLSKLLRMLVVDMDTFWHFGDCIQG